MTRREGEADRWAGLGTEQRNPRSRGLDTLDGEQIVSLLVAEDRLGLDAVERERSAVALAATWCALALGSGGSVVLAGAGTSGRLGVLEAAECPPTFGTDPERIRAVMAGGPDAVFRSREGAEDDQDAGRRAVAGLATSDLCIGLSASSVTPYTRGALEAASEAGARTVLITCAAADGLERVADLLIALDTGPEILTGSTRLKAGSATKAALNAVTTAAMVQLGKVFDNWMVDLRASSAKLRDRAVRITSEAGGIPPERAVELLEQAGGEVKVAIVAARLGVAVGEARERLREASGRVRSALAEAATARGEQVDV